MPVDHKAEAAACTTDCEPKNAVPQEEMLTDLVCVADLPLHRLSIQLLPGVVHPRRVVGLQEVQEEGAQGVYSTHERKDAGDAGTC
jgi:hypothetical protein